jgi:hypothetical protein
MTVFVLSLGNDALNQEQMEKERLAKAKALLRQQKKQAAKNAADQQQQQEMHGDGPHILSEDAPCKRPDCSKLRESDETEERIYEERLLIEEKLADKASALDSINQRKKDSNDESTRINEKTKDLTKKLRAKQVRAKELENERDGLEDLHKGMTNEIMVMQVEAQKARGVARQAQQALVDAMWRSCDDDEEGEGSVVGGSPGSRRTSKPLSPLKIVKTKPIQSRNDGDNWMRYSTLAGAWSRDVTEVIPSGAPAGGSNVQHQQQLQPNTFGSSLGSISARPMSQSGGQRKRLDQSLAPTDRRARDAASGMSVRPKTEPGGGAMVNRKLLLMMGSGKNRPVTGGGEPGQKKPVERQARSLIKNSVLREYKIEGAKEEEERLRKEKEERGTSPVKGGAIEGDEGKEEGKLEV